MSSEVLYSLALSLGIGASSLVILYFVIKVIKAIRAANSDGIDDSVTVDQILDAVDKYVRDGVDAGFAMALRAFDEFEAYLEGADKAAVANAMYDLIPDVVLVGGFPLPVSTIKRIVSREDFETLVKDAYDRVNGIVHQHEEYLRSQVDLLMGVDDDESPAE